jgi:hypothetical protein
MSEIRYITPTTSSSTTINPTNLFLPYRSNATTFLDSCLKQTSANQLQTIFAGINNGFSLQNATNTFLFGYISGGTNCFLEVNGTSRIIRYNDVGSPNGVNVNFAGNIYQFGKLTGTTTFLSISAGNLTCNYNGLGQGLSFAFATKLYQFGHLSGGTTTKLVVDDLGQQMNGEHSGTAKGMLLSFSSRVYTFGEITTNNRNNLVINDNLQQIFTQRAGAKTGLSIDTNLCTIGSLTIGNQLGIGTNDSSASFVFNGTNITTAGAGGNAGHIKILINGTPYRIAYQNP